MADKLQNAETTLADRGRIGVALGQDFNEKRPDSRHRSSPTAARSRPGLRWVSAPGRDGDPRWRSRTGTLVSGGRAGTAEGWVP